MLKVRESGEPSGELGVGAKGFGREVKRGELGDEGRRKLLKHGGIVDVAAKKGGRRFGEEVKDAAWSSVVSAAGE